MAPTFDPAKDLPDLTGKVVIVTGSTYVTSSCSLLFKLPVTPYIDRTSFVHIVCRSGIGLATAAVLLRKGAKVYFAARNEEKAKACIKRVEEEGLGPGNGQAVFLQLDLADPRGAKKAAEEFKAKEERLDILSTC